MKYALSGILVFVLVFTGGQAFYLSAKAKLAQVLLSRAWEKSLTHDQALKPWPWADIHAVGLLSVPRLNLKQVVLNNQQGEALAFGPGLINLDNTRVLAGHRDSHFAFLRLLSVGDKLQFTSMTNQAEKFTVVSIEIIDINQYSTLAPPLDSLSLVTCFPFESLGAESTQRFIVVAMPDTSSQEKYTNY